VPAGDGNLYKRVVDGVERELIEQVMQLCGGVQVKAADWLGINRNTLHKKCDQYKKPEAERNAKAPDAN
jgi:two-component system, NtrC family, response regulator HydG